MQNRVMEMDTQLKLVDALRYIHGKIIETLENVASEELNFNQLIGMIQAASGTENLYAQLTITLFDYYQVILQKQFISWQEYRKLEVLTQKLEEQVRGHIRIEQHLKIYVQGIDEKLHSVQKLKEQKLELEKKIIAEQKKNKLREEELIEKIQELQINLLQTRRISNNIKINKMESVSQELPPLKNRKNNMEFNNPNHQIIKSSHPNNNSLSHHSKKLSLPHLSYKEINAEEPNVIKKINNKVNIYISRSQAPIRQQSIIHTKQQLLKNMDQVYQNKKKNMKQKLLFQDSHLLVK